MCVSGPTIVSKLTVGGNMKFGSHRESLIPLIVESNTIRISFVPLGTEKKDVSARTILPWCSPWQPICSSCWTPLGLQKDRSLTSGDSSILMELPWSRDLPHPELGQDNSQTISKIGGMIHPPIPTKRPLKLWRDQEASCTLGRVSRRAIESISNLVAFPLPPLLDYLLHLVIHPPPRVAPYRVLSKTPYLSPSHLNIPWITLLFHNLRQSTCHPSRDLFTLWDNTKGYTSKTHLPPKSNWPPAS